MVRFAWPAISARPAVFALIRVHACGRRVASRAGAKWDLRGAAAGAGASEHELLEDSDEQGTSGEAASALDDDSAGEVGGKPKVVVGEDEAGKR